MATVEVVDHGRFLGSRLKGAQLRVVVESVLASRDRVVLDFAGVESITDSFAHELFGVLSAEHGGRSEEHTSELQSHSDLVCRLLLEKKNELNSGCTTVKAARAITA